MDTSSGGRPVLRPTGARFAAEETVRGEYVRYQQELAYQALCLGFVGAARAALLGLVADDFVEAAHAGEYFEVLRDRTADHDDVVIAIQRLISLPPERSLADVTGRFLACPASDRRRSPPNSD